MHKKNNRGFTLVELTVALSVGAIIAVMLSIVLVNINKVFDNKNYAMDKFNEFEIVKAQIVAVCDSYLSNGFSIQTNDDGNTLKIEKGQESILLSYNENKLLKNSENLAEFKTIKHCDFDFIENILVVNVEFTNNSKLRFIV